MSTNLSWGNVIGITLIAGFVVYITLTGHLKDYLGLFVSSGAATSSATGTGGAQPTSSSSGSGLGNAISFPARAISSVFQ